MDDFLQEESADVRKLLKTHFSLEKWLELPIMMRQRHLSMTRNYVMAVAEGLEAIIPLPNFLTKKPEEVEKEKAKGKRKIPIKTDVNANTVRDHPKRNIPKKNYFEDEVPRDDRYVFCDACQEEYIDSCPKCGQLISLKDVSVPMGVPDRAMKTVPKGILEVRPSPIHGLGTFALTNLRRGVRLGPYVGKLTRVESNKGYSWKLKNGFLIDASDASESNYLRYVNCARNIQEQNLVAFQYQGDIYYRTCREIKRSEELLVFYGPKFANTLGIDTKKYFEPNKEELGDVYFCDFCCIGLSTKEFRDAHQKRCKFGRKLIVFEGDDFKCKFCECLMASQDILKRHEPYCPKRTRIDNNRCGGNKNAEKRRFAVDCEEKPKTKSQMKFKRFQTYTQSSVSENVFKFKCPVCCEGFRYKISLDAHLLKMHPNADKYMTYAVHSCKVCCYKTVFLTNLTNHNVVHSKRNVPKHFCNHCHYETFYKRDLTRHLLLHSKNKPYKCDSCQIEFVRKSHLDNHILKYHRNKINQITNKIHMCKFCSFESINSHDMDRHYLKHTKENAPKYICDHCGYETYRRSNLKQHLGIHLEKKPYQCSTCQKQFTQKILLDNHIFNKHAEKRCQITRKIYSCNFCNYQTLLSSNFHQHNLKHSKIGS